VTKNRNPQNPPQILMLTGWGNPRDWLGWPPEFIGLWWEDKLILAAADAVDAVCYADTLAEVLSIRQHLAWIRGLGG